MIETSRIQEERTVVAVGIDRRPAFFVLFLLLLLLIALSNSANSINKWKKKQMLRSAVQTRVLRLRDVQPKVIGEKNTHSKNDANLPGLREKRRKLDNFFQEFSYFLVFVTDFY